MKPSSDPIFEAALRLPDHARADLAARLIESLDPSAEDDAELAWAEEVCRRPDQLDRGDVRTVPWSEARRLIGDADPDDAPENCGV